jgi:phosphoribosylanthranilate isomerase
MNNQKDGQSWPPKIQIAGVSSLDEAMFCAQAGVDAVGFTLEVPGGIHDGLTWERAASIIQKLPGRIWKVAITYLKSFEEISHLIDVVRPDAVQFHGGISAQHLSFFRKKYSTIKTIGRVTVLNEDSIALAAGFDSMLWDCIILDSMDPITGRLGATGIPHDWSLSSRIVKNSVLPVILAGGLTPENVVQAIITVMPAGVDAHTGVEDSDGSRNLGKIEAFAKAALQGFKNIKSTSVQV